MLWCINGYNICNITKRVLDKEEYLSELLKIDSELKNKILENLNKEGYVIGLKRKDILKAVYIFEPDTSKKILKFSESLSIKDIDNKIIEDFEKVIIKKLRGKVAMKEISKVDWNDIKILPNETSEIFTSAFTTCSSLGLLYAILLGNIYLIIIFFVAMGLSYEATIKFGTILKKRLDK